MKNDDFLQSIVSLHNLFNLQHFLNDTGAVWIQRICWKQEIDLFMNYDINISIFPDVIKLLCCQYFDIANKWYIIRCPLLFTLLHLQIIVVIKQCLFIRYINMEIIIFLSNLIDLYNCVIYLSFVLMYCFIFQLIYMSIVLYGPSLALNAGNTK